jgi:hypothetical protein
MGKLAQKHKFFLALLFGVLLVTAFQNCAQPKQEDPPGDDIVSKLPSDSSIDLQDTQLLSTSFQENNSDLSANVITTIRSKLAICELTLGSQRTDCMKGVLALYYEELSKIGYVVTKGTECYLAYKKSLPNTIHFDSTCESSPLKDFRRLLHLDECLVFPTTTQSSAVAFFRKGRNFERLDVKVAYRQPGIKHTEIYTTSSQAPIFKDACGNEYRAGASGVFVDFNILLMPPISH